MAEILANMVWVIHFFFVLFILITPFTDRRSLLVYHTIFVPSMLLHWLTNNNTCSLTLVEKRLRKKHDKKDDEEDDCFTCKIIEPIYDFRKNNYDYSLLIYIVTLGLFAISSCKVYNGLVENNFSIFEYLNK